MQSFGEKLRELRERQRPPMSQGELALKIGMERTNLSKIENGRIKIPTMDTQRRLADGLGMKWDEFVREMRLEPEPMPEGDEAQREMVIAHIRRLKWTPDVADFFVRVIRGFEEDPARRG